MTPQERVIAAAKAELGYLEKASAAELDDKTANAGRKNYTKYARDLGAIPNFYNGRKQGSSWCDVFVDWCFVRTFGVELTLKLLCQPMGGCGAGVLYSARYFQAKGRLMSTPKPGDQIFFGEKNGNTITKGSHTGLVTGVDKTYVYTIEGNTSGASGVVPNGGGVCAKKYRLNNKKIVGYGRPDWSLVKEEVEMTNEEVKKLVAQEVEKAVKPLDDALTKAIQSMMPEKYNAVAELPEWARPAVKRLVDGEILKGDGAHEINLTDADLVTVAMVDRVLAKMEEW